MTDFDKPNDMWTQLATISLPAVAAATEPPARNEKGRFLPGGPGGPGRPKGSRAKLSALLLSALETEFKRSAPEIITKAATSDPMGFLRVAASLLPQQVILEHLAADPDYSDMSNEEISEMLRKEERNVQVRKLFAQLHKTV